MKLFFSYSLLFFIGCNNNSPNNIEYVLPELWSEPIEDYLDVGEKIYPNDFMRLTFDEKGRKFKETISESIKKPNGVIISAKAGTGIDLKGEKSRFQIIIKAPYISEVSNDDNARAQKIRKNDASRYWIKSMFRLIQFAGRSVRGLDDYATTYVLDQSAKSMIRNNLDHVPQWFHDACHPSITIGSRTNKIRTSAEVAAWLYGKSDDVEDEKT